MNINPNDVLQLDDSELRSSTWLKVQAYLLARLDAHRRANDAELTPERTAMLRGRLAEIKNLIATGETQDDHQ